MMAQARKAGKSDLEFFHRRFIHIDIDAM